MYEDEFNGISMEYTVSAKFDLSGHWDEERIQGIRLGFAKTLADHGIVDANIRVEVVSNARVPFLTEVSA